MIRVRGARLLAASATAFLAFAWLPASAPARTPARAAQCSGSVWCSNLDVFGLSAWDGLNGNTGSQESVLRYFGIGYAFRLPTGRSYLRTLVDQHAVHDREAGQRTIAYLFPSDDPTLGKTQAFEGSDRWYRTSVAFPRAFQPSPATTWNWVVEWHNWPNSTCCANLALTVDTSQRGRGQDRNGRPRWRQKLSLRVMGGGNPNQPADGEGYEGEASNNSRVRTAWLVGDPYLNRGHWYDVLVHVRWSYQASRGLVEWWLDGRRVGRLRVPTLFWYADNNENLEGATPGPGQAYWMLGYYRPSRRRGEGPDTTEASVLHNGARSGPTRASVRY